MKIIPSILLIALFTVSCTSWKEHEVTITKDYVINPNWSETDNSFEISRMVLKDSFKNLELQNPVKTQLYHRLKKDTSFTFIGFVEYNGEDYAKRKVYFNRDNGFLWWKDLHNPSSTKTVLGELQKENWYLFGGLSNCGTLYFVHIDASDSIQVVKINHMTNI